jgi:Zn-dependent alcohol dehydrogenase
MKTRAAVLRKGGTPREITELELDPPQANEVLIRMEAAGLCHSDEHIRARGTARLPMVGGHEGAGVVVEVGPGVTRVQVGDRASCSDIPVCGKCRYCSTGKQNLCDAGRYAGVGCLPDKTLRFQQRRRGLRRHVRRRLVRRVLGAVGVVVREDRGLRADRARGAGELRRDHRVVLGHLRGRRAVGDTVVVFGTGGVGMNAVQGARYAGAKCVFAIDPNRLYDIPMILSLWNDGRIKLTELITKKYTLDEINEGYADLMDGKNLRGVIVHQHWQSPRQHAQ